MKRRELIVGLAALPLAQGSQQPIRRRPVVPRDVVEKFGLRKANGFGPYCLAEDGTPIDLDDIIAVLFEISKEHWKKK